MSDRIFNVLFLCTGNSARSIMAEALLGKMGGGRFKAFSAGSMPAGQVNPGALRMLGTLGYETEHFRSKNWSEFDTATGGPVMDFAFTVCDSAAAEVCPVWPGQPITAHWGIADPAAVSGSEAEISAAFAQAYRLLRHRIEAFVSLPVESLDRMTLQSRLDAIGRP
ncbi:MAG: ArsR family transcriptional regulator [Maricaulis sp.]|jgi:protein-tyrosine-phosphatase|nr:ArsR family transcriptional regulator [Maricaulis sp.]HAQ34904.1 ArsR family transcriptional regulator [Alphaproteobacteria bacterium]|tara:strand:+ start:347 stop:844 length:498 start_codon:yes stop_codon:yes gene_type:complete